MLRRYRHRRRWIAFVAVFGLLFQQLAMASYVCPHATGATPSALAGSASTIGEMPPCHGPAATDQARCHQHCHPDATSVDHAPALVVPPAMLPATTWQRGFALAHASLASDSSSELIARAGAPPLTIQYCTFQI
ncbi:MAG: hypothetical protein ABJB02_02705 [Dokdonella sp.]